MRRAAFFQNVHLQLPTVHGADIHDGLVGASRQTFGLIRRVVRAQDRLELGPADLPALHAPPRMSLVRNAAAQVHQGTYALGWAEVYRPWLPEPLPLPPAQPRIERVAEHVEAEDREEDGNA